MSQPINVLIIEDNEDDALLAVRSLRKGELQLDWLRVETPDELIEALQKRSWDVIISDYNLPSFNAPRALEIVKQSHLDLPFIVVSGTIGETSAVELMKQGASDYLMKGNLTRLAEAVRREVREAQIRLERKQSELELAQTKERLQLALEGSAIGLWDWAVKTGGLTVNERWGEMLGYTIDELEPINIETWQNNTHPEDIVQTNQMLERHFCGDIPAFEYELRMRHKLGTWAWILCRGKVVERDANGNPMRMTGTHLDISDRKQAELRLSIQRSMLERIAKAEPLPQILEALVIAFEEQLGGGALCSILLCDREGALHYGAAPHFPEAYNQAIEGVIIGEAVGSCGTAAFRKELVIVSDIATDPLWQDFKELALTYNLRACWSAPVIASDGEVLATFAVYHSEIHHPTPQELEVINLATDITKIAIEREQAAKALEQLNHSLEVRVEERTAELRHSEAKLIEAQQIARLGSWELDVKTREISYSAEFLNIFGIKPTQSPPSYEELSQYFPPDEQQHFNQLVDLVIQFAEPFASDFKIIRADGSSGYIFNKAELLCDHLGQETRLFGIAMDISDRKAMQEALQLSEERARATLLALPDLVFRVNRSGEYVDFLASPNVGNIVDPQIVIGKRLADYLPPHIWEKEKHILELVLDTQTLQTYEQQIVIDGQLRFEEVRVAPCGNDEVVFFVRDISDRKQAESQLQKTNEELIRATRLKDEFLANMSHELRTPLNAILGMTEGLQEGVFGAVSDRQIKALQTVERSGTHLLSLINDILDVAKIESGQLELNLTSTSIDQLCQSSLAFIKQLAHQKHIDINVKISSKLPDLMLDERRMRQVLINLLNNAVKFTPEGGKITLTVDAAVIPEAPPSDSLPRQYMQIKVADTGIGIAPENLNKLFKPFVQIDGALNRQFEGTGLGLALVKQMVELHGGKVSVTSNIGQGSCFTVVIPFYDPSLNSTTTLQLIDLASTIEIEPIQEEELRSPLILLAEDNEANIGTMSCYLEARGYKLIFAKNGQEAIALTKAQVPSLILMDIQMPIIDGLEAIKQIRSDSAFDTIPIIALTALAMAGDRETCLAAGANEYMSKPVRLKLLVDTMKQLLN